MWDSFLYLPVTEGKLFVYALCLQFLIVVNSSLRLYLIIIVLVLFYKIYMNICKGKDHLM